MKKMSLIIIFALIFLLFIMVGCSDKIDDKAEKNDNTSYQQEEVSEYSIMENSELSIGFNNVKIICHNKDRKDGEVCKEPELLIDGKRYPLPTKYSEGVKLKVDDFTNDSNLDLFITNWYATGTGTCITEGYLYAFINKNTPQEIFHNNHENPIKYIKENTSINIDNNDGSYYIGIENEGKSIGEINIPQEYYGNEVVTKEDISYGSVLHYLVNENQPRVEATVSMDMFVRRPVSVGALTLAYSYKDGKFVVAQVKLKNSGGAL